MAIASNIEAPIPLSPKTSGCPEISRSNRHTAIDPALTMATPAPIFSTAASFDHKSLLGLVSLLVSDRLDRSPPAFKFSFKFGAFRCSRFIDQDKTIICFNRMHDFLLTMCIGF
jgi:hypothetical protein